MPNAIGADTQTDRYPTIEGDSTRFEMDPRSGDVLALGSQLLYGSVGLNAAVPVYEGSGLRCIAVPTVVLSNLPHYPSVHRADVDEPWLAGSLNDLVTIGALRLVRAVAIGYLADPGQAETIAHWFRSAHIGAGSVPLILDPTLGDDDVGFYTDPEVAPALQRHLVPLASGITPNRFELAQLTGRTLAADASLDEVAESARSLFSPATEWVIVTGNRCSHPYEPGSDTLADVIVTRDGAHTLWHRRLPTETKGQGDLFTAALVRGLLDGASLRQAAADAARVVRHGIQPSLAESSV